MSIGRATVLAETYADGDRELDLRWWAAANYLTVAQIYLKSNPLLRDPLTVEDIKPRLLGHWGTSPGLSMIYTLLNRLIRDTGTDCVYVTGPGHGGPALLANAYLEGTYSEIYPQDKFASRVPGPMQTQITPRRHTGTSLPDLPASTRRR